MRKESVSTAPPQAGPRDVQAERAVLGGVLLNPDAASSPLAYLSQDDLLPAS